MTPAEPKKAPAVGAVPAAEGDGLHRFADEAMATTWGIFIAGDDAEYAGQAARAAFEELHRLETELSRFNPASDVSQISRLPAGRAIRVGLDTFDCLKAAAWAHRETGGAFDVTLGRLQDLWWPKGGRSAPPADAEVAEARRHTGMHLLVLDEREHAVGVRADEVRIDLGGIGKGYAVERMVELLRDWSIASALVHGGRSTVFGMGTPPEKDGWPIAPYAPGKDPGTLGSAVLKDRALSGSGSPAGNRHILDPRTGRPAEGNAAAWVVCERPSYADALSTALLVMAPQEMQEFGRRHPDVSGMMLREGEEAQVHRFGAWAT